MMKHMTGTRQEWLTARLELPEAAKGATCTLHAEGFDHAIIHLNHRDVSMACASRGPLAQLGRIRR
jgi:predicted dithiol-disulfide oxidoreductase (DUF899 family)